MTIAKWILYCTLLLIGAMSAYAQNDTAQIRTERNKPDSIHTAIYSYYFQEGLHLDSAKSVVLYNQVYEWRGTKYKYAGHSKAGVDCSGFVCAMYDTAYHIQIGGSALSLYAQVDTVPRDSLREGDILFFKIKKNQISHVGIYLRDDKFAHASVHNGVIVSDLKEAYYKKYYFVGGRLKEK